MIICFGCTKGYSQHKSYNSDEAIKKGDVVVTLGVQNFERFQEFTRNVENGIQSKVRIASYTIEGDPIFIDLEYDGKYIFYTNDYSNEEFGTKEIIKDQCTKIDKKVNERNEYDYLISGCSNKASYPLFSIEKRQ